MTKKALERGGWTVVMATSGIAGWEKFAGGTLFDAVLTDINCAQEVREGTVSCDGIWLAGKIRAVEATSPAKTTIVFMSGDLEGHVVAEIHSMSHHFVDKPFPGPIQDIIDRCRKIDLYLMASCQPITDVGGTVKQ